MQLLLAGKSLPHVTRYLSVKQAGPCSQDLLYMRVVLGHQQDGNLHSLSDIRSTTTQTFILTLSFNYTLKITQWKIILKLILL